MPINLVNENRSQLVKLNRWLRLGVVSGGAALLWATTSHASAPELELAMQQLNQQFSSGVIIPHYEAVDLQMQGLVLTTESFEAEPTADNLAAIRTAWLGAVAQWTSSNAVAFGPVDSLGYRTALEVPVDEAGLDAMLADAAESEDFDVASLLPSLQGFEAMAYLLGTEGEKMAADFSVQERRYLSALAVRAQEVTSDILEVWQAGWENYPAYSTLLSTAGNPDNPTYLSVEAGSEEIIRTMINTLDVVAAEELPDILEASDLMAEAPDMLTLKLLDSSLQGVQSAYLGVVDGDAESAAGVSELVAIANPTVDQQIQSSFVVALDSIEQTMADPTNVSPLVEAQLSLDIAFELLETEVLPLVQN